MKKESIQAYTNRIIQANRSELVVITYEIVIENIQNAQSSFLNSKVEFACDLQNAQKFLKELIVSLDFQYEISNQLLSIYLFINKTLIESKQKNSITLLPRIEGILKNLMSSFQKISEQDKSGPVMMNAETIYAGLTYGKNDLNEVKVGSNEESRGFLA